MRACVVCKTPTDLYVSNVPTCPKCCERLEQDHKKVEARQEHKHFVQTMQARTRWGDWRLATFTHHLVLDDGSDTEAYSIHLDQITDSAHMLDWIFQVRAKSWATNDLVANLLDAFQDIFQPQQTFCGYGDNKRLNAAVFLEARLKQQANT